MYFADKCLSSQILLFYHAENYVPSFYAAVPAVLLRKKDRGWQGVATGNGYFLLRTFQRPVLRPSMRSKYFSFFKLASWYLTPTRVRSSFAIRFSRFIYGSSESISSIVWAAFPSGFLGNLGLVFGLFRVAFCFLWVSVLDSLWDSAGLLYGIDHVTDVCQKILSLW